MASNFWFKVTSKYNTLKHISAYHYWHYYVLQLKIFWVGTFKHLFSNQILNLPFIWGTFIKFRPVLPEIMGLTDANIQTSCFVRHMSGRNRSNSPNLMRVIRYNICHETSLNSVRSSFYLDCSIKALTSISTMKALALCLRFTCKFMKTDKNIKLVV